jgi:hypothetical protein
MHNHVLAIGQGVPPGKIEMVLDHRRFLQPHGLSHLMVNDVVVGLGKTAG